MLVAEFVFYALAFVLVLSAVLVILARHPVHSVLFLILAFFNAAGLFVLIGAEYLAMTLVIVYVGAVAVLFLFVVMMLNVDVAAMRQGFLRMLPLGLGVGLALLVEIVLVAAVTLPSGAPMAPRATPVPDAALNITNAHAIGQVLYTQYAYLFQVAGLVLLVSMIGAIVLTLRHRPGVRRQDITRQHGRRRSESVVLVEVESGRGV